MWKIIAKNGKNTCSTNVPSYAQSCHLEGLEAREDLGRDGRTSSIFASKR
jgi:hypothetical protein